MKFPITIYYDDQVEDAETAAVADLQEGIKLVKNAFPVNKHARNQFDRLVLKILADYHTRIVNEMNQARKRFLALKDRQGPEGSGVIRKMARNISHERENHIRVAFPIGRQSVLHQLRRQGFMEADSKSGFNVRYEKRKQIWSDGTGFEKEVPVLSGMFDPLDDIDEKRIQEMIDGTEYSVGLARYKAGPKGSFVDNQTLAAYNRMVDMDHQQRLEYDPEQPWPSDEVVNEEFDRLAGRAAMWSREVWAVYQKGVKEEWRDFQKDNPDAGLWYFVGADDSESCDDCLDAMSGNPYDNIDDVPEPGEQTCQCNCRHAIVFEPSEGEQQDEEEAA